MMDCNSAAVQRALLDCRPSHKFFPVRNIVIFASRRIADKACANARGAWW